MIGICRSIAVVATFLYLAGSFIRILLHDGWRPPHLSVDQPAFENVRRVEVTRLEQTVEPTSPAELSPLEQLRAVHFPTKR
ncbi:MAG: hypothetical protein HOJ57_28610 [Lentisphaerae bacterium]|jgi:hypothetical protein|nr:hypothetical protein [Lentisphaerota bacterium]